MTREQTKTVLNAEAAMPIWRTHLAWMLAWWRATPWARWGVGCLFMAAATIWSWREFRTVSWHHVRATLDTANPFWVAAAIISAIVVALVMGLYAAYSFPAGDGGLRFGTRWWIGIIVAGIANLVGMGGLGSTSIRFWVYTHKGLTPGEVTTGVAWLGATSVTALLGWSVAVYLPLPALGGFELLLRLVVVVAVAITAFRWASRRLPAKLVTTGAASLPAPPVLPMAASAVVEWGASAFCLYALGRAVGLSVGIDESFQIYFAGIVTGMISLIPGGAGTADTVWLTLLQRHGADAGQSTAAILLLRVVAYFGPFVFSVAGGLFLFNRFNDNRILWQRRLLALSTGMGAVLFILSAATPALPSRLAWLEEFTPIGLVELSHLVAVLSGALLLFLARGIWRGYRSAFIMVGALLVASLVAQILKGADFEEAFVGGVLLVFLLSARSAFKREGGLDLNVELAIGIGLAAIFFYLLAGLTAFERIPYRPELWTHFAAEAEASRFLRAAVALVLLVAVIVVRRAVRPTKRRVFATPAEIERTEKMVRNWADSADGLLIGGGDKAVWFWEDRGLVVYQIEGSKMICLKDPIVAPGADRRELMRALLAEANRQDRELVFSMIGAKWWETLHDFGFHLLKLTEEALLDLPAFSLEGGERKGLRKAMRNVEKTGVTFEMLEPPHPEAVIDGCRTVSDAWLAFKGGHELQFSACYFSAPYLQRHPLGIARTAEGEIIAFVNLLLTRPGGPATLDFMRYIPRRVDELMEVVIIRSALEAKEFGASTFSLGGAAMRAVGEERTAHRIEKLLNSLSERTESIYNYEGLERYKAKFRPRWEPRYLAYQNPIDWAPALIASGRLVQARRRVDRLCIAAARNAPSVQTLPEQ